MGGEGIQNDSFSNKWEQTIPLNYKSLGIKIKIISSSWTQNVSLRELME